MNAMHLDFGFDDGLFSFPVHTGCKLNVHKTFRRPFRDEVLT